MREINEHIHRKNVNSKEELLEMFSAEQRCNYIVKYYSCQVENFIDDALFLTEVSKFNEFEFAETEVASTSELMEVEVVELPRWKF